MFSPDVNSAIAAEVDFMMGQFKAFIAEHVAEMACIATK